MIRALCTLDGVTYNAVDFNQTDDFANKKNALACIACGVSAKYRSRGRDGRKACFFAKHTEGCTLAALVHESGLAGEVNTVNNILTLGQRVVVNFDIGSSLSVPETQPTRSAVVDGRQSSRLIVEAGPRDETSRTLSSLLRTLMSSDQFSRTQHVIHIAGQNDYISSDFFVKFADITKRHIGRYHGFWGSLSEINSSEPTILFKSGDNDDLSAYLDLIYEEDIYYRFNLAALDEETDVHMLVFGELKRAINNGNIYVEITDPSRFTLRLDRRSN